MQAMIDQAEQDLLHTYNRYQIVLDRGDGMYLYDINGKKYPVVGEMCMNMTAIKVDSSVKIDDEVTLLGDGITVGMFGRSSGMGNAEALVNIGKNNPRFYVKDGKVVKEK